MLRPTTVTVLSVATLACTPALQRSRGAASTAQPADLWIGSGQEPRDLFAGPDLHPTVRPKTDDGFTVVKRDTGGLPRDLLTDRQNIQAGLELR